MGSRGRGIKRTISRGRRIGGVWGITWGRCLRRRGKRPLVQGRGHICLCGGVAPARSTFGHKLRIVSGSNRPFQPVTTSRKRPIAALQDGLLTADSCHSPFSGVHCHIGIEERGHLTSAHLAFHQGQLCGHFKHQRNLNRTVADSRRNVYLLCQKDERGPISLQKINICISFTPPDDSFLVGSRVHRRYGLSLV